MQSISKIFVPQRILAADVEKFCCDVGQWRDLMSWYLVETQGQTFVDIYYLTTELRVCHCPFLSMQGIQVELRRENEEESIVRLEWMFASVVRFLG